MGRLVPGSVEVRNSVLEAINRPTFGVRVFDFCVGTPVHNESTEVGQVGVYFLLHWLRTF